MGLRFNQSTVFPASCVLVVACLTFPLVKAHASPSLENSAAGGNATGTAGSANSDIVCPGARPLVNNLYFGDIHIHTSYSMDAYVRDTRNTPWDTYSFARGGIIGLGPVDVNGEPTRSRRLPAGQALDFAAVTDHSEYLGEVSLCSDPELDPQAYNTAACTRFRDEGSFVHFKDALPDRLPELCGIDGQGCDDAASLVWQDTIRAANVSNVPCQFTTFIGYEWTAQPAGALHRNVIFRNDQVPALPFSAFASSDPQDLWDMLDLDCPPGSGCEAITIPHNTNLSRGQSLRIQYPVGATLDEERMLAGQRQRLERLLEIIQHKGTSECLPGYSNDELCNFELFQPSSPPCSEGESPAAGGGPCVAEIDTFRGALKEGLAEHARIGVNPIVLGAVASTDTHNGTAGDVAEDRWAGHNGAKDATPYQRLAQTSPRSAPGGLIAVWASQNTREAIYGAMHRRETFATSGPRMAVRFFGAPGFLASDCESQNIAYTGYRKGIPMGGEMVDGMAPRMAFLIDVLADQVPIDRIQVIKGFIDDSGTLQETILEDPAFRHPLDGNAPPSCEEGGVDCPPLCGVIVDTGFQAHQPAFYYARVLEHATPRWSSTDCAFSPRTAALPVCQPGVLALPETIQERAWTSPIWYQPTF